MNSQINAPDEQVEIFSSWLESINTQTGTTLALDADRRLCLQMGEQVIVGLELSPTEGIYRIYAPLMELREKSELPLLARALALNLYQKGTAGGVIGLDAEYGMLIYSLTQDLGSSGPELLARQLDRAPSIVTALRGILQEARDPKAELTPAERSLIDEDGSGENGDSLEDSQPPEGYPSLA